MRALAPIAVLLLTWPVAAEETPSGAASDTDEGTLVTEEALVDDKDQAPTEEAVVQSSALLAAREDDPKLQRQAGVVHRGPRADARHHPTPALKLAYRNLKFLNLDRSDLEFHAFELDLYPISARWIRVGLDGELGFSNGAIEDKVKGLWFLTTGVNLGFQFPWRVTPFVDARFVAGLIGGEILGNSVVSWTFTYGVDAGVELYLAGRLYLTAAIGWAHPTYKGVDLDYQKMHPLEEPKFIEISNDTFTFKLGVGL